MLLIKISLLFSLLLPDSGKWQRIQTPECISFLFPNTPEKIVNTNNGIRSTIYQTKDLTCVFGIGCSDMSSIKIRITSEFAQILYEELKKGVYLSKRRSSKKKKRFLTKIWLSKKFNTLSIKISMRWPILKDLFSEIIIFIKYR